MFDSSFYSKLSRLKIAMSHKSNMNMSGNRKSVQKGSSAEFSDFREYMAGDDIRRIDWNAYGRLDRLYIKEYMEEKEMTVSIIIDSSASMDYGERSKKDLCLSLAAALSYVALNNMDRVAVYDAKNMERPFLINTGKKNYPRLLSFIENISFGGECDICMAVKKLPEKGAGTTIILSDFMDEQFVSEDREALKLLMKNLIFKKQKISLLHILALEELVVDMSGTMNLIDSENEKNIRVTMDASSITAYTNELEGFINKIKKTCLEGNGNYVLCSTANEFDKIIFEELRNIYDI